MSDLELPNYEHERMNVIKITDIEVNRGLKGIKRESTRLGRNEVVDVAGEICARWTKRLLNTMQRAGRLAETDNCPHVEKERIYTRPREVQRNNSAGSYYEIAREDSGQEVA